MSNKTYAYIRVSTEGQNVEKNRAEILEFANAKGLSPVTFIEEKVSSGVSWKDRKLGDIINGMSSGDIIIVSEFSRLGRSLLECMSILSEVSEKESYIYSVKDKWQLDDSIESQATAAIYGLAAGIEKKLIQERTREALRHAKSKGTKLGRPKGAGKSKLDQHDEEIKALLANGSTQRFIANRYNTTPANLCNWIKKHGLDNRGNKVD
jgi:DNA invertase Pin-like site-specific DNA recombinase